MGFSCRSAVWEGVCQVCLLTGRQVLSVSPGLVSQGRNKTLAGDSCPRMPGALPSCRCGIWQCSFSFPGQEHSFSHGQLCK